MNRELLVRWGNLTFDVKTKKDVDLLTYILRNIHQPVQQPKPITVTYDEKFQDYLLRDRRLDSRTARDYMNYLKRLHGRQLDYDLYLSISSSRWMVKTVRLYIDYLYKSNQIDEQTRDRLLSIFKVKSTPKSPHPYSVDAINLVEPIKRMARGQYRTILLVLYYSGARLSEVVHMLRGFDPNNLMCFDGFCRYWLGWHRGKKRCDWLYFPKELLPSIYSINNIGKYTTIRDTLHDHYKVKPKDYRKHFYQTCRDLEIPKEVCDFYQSRISSLTIGDIHYDNLLKRADIYYTQIMEELKKRLGF